jgi:hypothetical protein
MKYDQFVYFSILSAKQQQELKPFLSPNNEQSLFKKVPIDRMEEFKLLARQLVPQGRIRARFRGPREGAMRDYTLKRKARSVAIYVDQG